MVLAKPAEQTPRIAAFAVSLMHRAGVPKDAIQLLCGSGTDVGAALTIAGQADMVVFTGSTHTAKLIESAIADSAKPDAPLIAETATTILLPAFACAQTLSATLPIFSIEPTEVPPYF